MKTTVYVGTSVDGFIARADHTVDFLDAGGPVDGDMGFGQFFASVDALVMGRNTFDLVIASGFDWPYGDTPVIVVTSRPVDVPQQLRDVVETSDLAPPELCAELSHRGLDHVYVDGGLTVQAWLRAGLVDDLIVTRVPVLIGAGISLFGDLAADIALRHVDTTVYENGCVQTHWRTDRPTDGQPDPS